MATTPTNLPVPSESPRDLKFNAGKIDEFVTSPNHTYTDRFGVQHWTISGIQFTAAEAIGQLGYITLDSFEEGAVLTLPNQALRYEATGEYYRWDGAYPKEVTQGSTPENSGGIGVGAWVSVGDAALRGELNNSNGISLVGGSIYVVDSFASAKTSSPGRSLSIMTKGHTIPGVGSANYFKDGTTGAPSSGDEIKFFDAMGNGWKMDLSDAVGIPITRFGLVPGVDTPTQATTNAAIMKRGGERTFDVGLRVILPPAKFYVNDVVFSKPVGVMGFTAGLGANQTGIGGGFDGFSEWVHRGTGWAIYYEPWLRTNGAFDPDAISLNCFCLRGNIQGGVGVSLGGVKINDDSVINDETKAKRDLVMTDITISGFWSGYGLRISWCFINVLTRVKIWDCGVCYLANRANATTHFGCSIETTLQGVTVLESADFSWYGGMLEYTNASKSYHSMPPDYPVDTNWAAGVNSYKGIGFRSRGSKASFYGGYCEGSLVFFQVELNSDTIIDGVRFQLGDMVANHVVRSHGGYSLTVVRCKIDGSLITGAPFYRTPSQSYIGKYFIHDNIYTSTTVNPPMRPVTNPTLGFQGEFDIYGVATSDYPLKRFMFGKSIEAYDTLNGQNNGSTPVYLKGDLIGCRQVTVNATGATFAYDVGGTTHAVGGVVHINTPAGCAVTVSATNLSNWPEGAEISVVPVSSGTSGSPATIAFSSTFRLATGNDDISTTSGKRAIYTFKLMNGSLYQMGLAKSV